MNIQGRNWRTDAAIAVAVVVIQVAGTHASSSWHAGHPGRHVAVGVIGYLLLLAGGLALLWRRRYPVTVLAVTLGIQLTAGYYGSWFASLALIVAFFTAVFARKRAAAIASLLIGYLGSVLPAVLPGGGSGDRPSPAFAVGLLAWLLVLLAAAELIRARRERAADLHQARQDEMRRRALAERMAIARDLHDVVSHNISVINVQASTALHLMDRQPERAKEALTAIHDVSKQALTELRSVLEVLRGGEGGDSGGDGAPMTPGPGIDQVADLAARARSAGLAVQVTRSGEPRPLPAEVGVAVYRIVQEALTNTARHAAGSPVTVRIGYTAEALSVEVDDDGPVAGTQGARFPRPDDGSGNGIIGMTERAQALGGSLKAGPRPAGGYRVQAILPLAVPAESARR